MNIGSRGHHWKLSEITKKKMSNARKGIQFSEETRRRISEAGKGRKAWNKGIPISEETRNKIRGRHHTEEEKKKMSEFWKSNPNHFWKGRHRSEETKQKISKKLKGQKISKEARQKNSLAHSGKKSHLWKGGITPITKRIRHSFKYNQWHQQIFSRDNFTCRKCNGRGRYLHAHHEKKFSQLLEEVKRNLPLLDLYEGAMVYTPLWDLDNGITLCEKCHQKTLTFKRRQE